VAEAGVAVANRLTAAARPGSRVAGRERIDGKPGDADLPVEECAESAGRSFRFARLARASGSVSRSNSRSAWRRRTASCNCAWDDRVVGKTKVPRIVPTNSFVG
jgi:hypothetical protein